MGFASADDYEESNGAAVLAYEEAIEKARDLARAGRSANPDDATSARPLTVAEAFDNYADDLRARGKDPYNAALGKTHVPAAILSKPVALLRSGELRKYRNGLRKTHKGCSVNRITSPFKAALELAAREDHERIRNQAEWRHGLAPLEDDSQPNNVVLTDDEVRRLVEAAYAHDEAFGLLLELEAVSGARYSQLGRIRVRDLQIGQECRVMIPTSHKGRSKRKFEDRPFPLARAFALKLQKAAAGRAPDEPLLLKTNGSSWKKGHEQEPFAAALTAAGVEPRTLPDGRAQAVTMYALRHTSIPRRRARGVPVRAAAAAHDTSVQMIEKTYSAFIHDHIDPILRAALIDLTPPIAVVAA